MDALDSLLERAVISIEALYDKSRVSRVEYRYQIFSDFMFLHFRQKDSQAEMIGNRYGPGKSTGRIWLDKVQCGGPEKSIADCEHSGWGIHSCDHSKDVSVSCGG